MRTYRILALSLALLLLLSACGGSGEEDAVQPAETLGVAVQAEEIAADAIAAETTVSGSITADDEATVMVGSSAKCTAVYVEAGDTVTAGQALCALELDSTLSSYAAANISYQSALQSYEDQSGVFEKQIALYEKTLQDLKELFAIGAASQMEIDQAELQLASAQATRNSTLAQLEAGMQSSKSNVEQLAAVLENVDSRGNVIAPIAGTVVNFSAVEGGYVSPSAPVAIIQGVEQMKIVVSVSEALVPKLKTGDTASVTVSAVEQTFEAVIRSVEKAASMQTKLYTVTLSVPSGLSGLLAGMFADVTFHTDVSENTIVIPTEAILTSGSTQYVFTVENGNTARYAEITTGLTGSGVTEVLSGLSAGQQLVTVGQAYLSDGDPVRIVSGEDAPSAGTTAPEEDGADADAPASGEE